MAKRSRKSGRKIARRSNWSYDAVVIFLFFSVNFLTVPKNLASPANVRHQTLANDSAISILTQKTCYDLYITKTRLICAPSPFVIINPGRISIDTILKIDDSTYELANKILTEKVSKSYVQHLFEKESYQAASGSISIKAIYSSFAIIYTPQHVSAAYKVSNPSLPEIYANAYLQSQIRVVKNFIFNMGKNSLVPDFMFSVSPFIYDRRIYLIDTDIVRLAIQQPKEIIKKRANKDLDFDASFSVFPKQAYLPQVSLSILNAKTPPACSACKDPSKDTALTVEKDLHRHFAGTLAYSLPVTYGFFNLSTVGFWSEQDGFDLLDTPLTMAYKVSSFASAYTFSARRHGLGFFFEVNSYSLGLQFSDEKQDNVLLFERKKQSYILFNLFI